MENCLKCQSFSHVSCVLRLLIWKRTIPSEMDLFKTWHVLRCCKTLPDAQIPDLFRSVDLNFQTSTFNWSKVNKTISIWYHFLFRWCIKWQGCNSIPRDHRGLSSSFRLRVIHNYMHSNHFPTGRGITQLTASVCGIFYVVLGNPLHRFQAFRKLISSG